MAPDFKSQRISDLSVLPESINFPFGAKAAAVTIPVCPLKVRNGLPSDIFQSFKVASALADKTILLSGENTASLTLRVWSLNFRMGLCVDRSQSRMVQSQLPDKARFPFDEKATELTMLTWPLNVVFPAFGTARTTKKASIKVQICLNIITLNSLVSLQGL
jgi:hypothetical protein